MKITKPTSNTPLATRVAALQHAIKAATGATLSKRPDPVLVAVSKTHPPETIEEAIGLGLKAFGENKVQEALTKYPALKAKHPHIMLHLIGSLQSNKAKEAVALFDVIHTIDRPKIADAVLKEALKQNRVTPSQDGVHASTGATSERTGIDSGLRRNDNVLKCMIQVNVGEEEQKAGVLPRDVAALLKHCRDIGLPIDGLMCIPPAGENPAPYFALMQQLAIKHGLKELSMGMSSDYQTALRFGATMVRVGTALFGERA